MRPEALEEEDGEWAKSPTPNLVRYKSSGTYFIRARIGGKLIRRSLQITVYPVATVRLSDFLCEQRAAQPSAGDFNLGRMTFGQAFSIFESRLVAARLRLLRKEGAQGRSSITESITKASPVKTCRKFDVAFKLEAVRNWQAGGKSAAVIAKELGLAERRLFAWHPSSRPADAGGKAAAGGKPVVSEFQARPDAALRENRHLKRVSA